MKIHFTILAIAAFVLIFSSCENGQPSSAVEENQTDTTLETNLVGKELTYSADTTEMRGYIAYDESIAEKRPGILVVHEWWGHTDYVRMRADMLAKLGYVALAVDMYGDGQKADHPDDAKKFAGMVMSNMETSVARFQAAYDQLAQHPQVDPASISAVGYCFGGSLILAFANAGMDLDGVAAFHSGVQLPVMPGEELQAKVLVQNGADDPMVSPQSVETYKAAMDAVDASYEYITYPNATHAYTNPHATEIGNEFDLPLAYHAEADKKSWDKLQAFLSELYPR